MGKIREQEIESSKEDISAQAVVIEKEKQLQQVAEEEKPKMDEGLRWVQGSPGQLKDKKEPIHQEKEKLKRMAETKIERLKEEVWQQKDQDDRLRS